jgi:uncharacterized membrane protein YdjX (TVP38/TMEM64 family)
LTCGLVFGPVTATLYALTGTLLGAAVSFGIGRGLGRAQVVRMTAGRTPHTRLGRLDEWLARRGFLTVVCARLLPIVPFGLLNYGFGATRVRASTFVLGTAVGILPSTVLYTVVGASATDPGSPTFVISTVLSGLAAVAGVLLARHSTRVMKAGGEHSGAAAIPTAAPPESSPECTPRDVHTAWYSRS